VQTISFACRGGADPYAILGAYTQERQAELNLMGTKGWPVLPDGKSNHPDPSSHVYHGGVGYAAFAPNEKATNWGETNVLEFMRGMPEVMVGNALVAEVT
jgi:hypothetical protein